MRNSIASFGVRMDNNKDLVARYITQQVTINKINVNPNDIIVLRTPFNTSNAMIDNMIQDVRGVIGHGTKILVLPDTVSIDIMHIDQQTEAAPNTYLDDIFSNIRQGR
jgi:hypothetical protein